jgi:hypothetical protein
MARRLKYSQLRYNEFHPPIVKPRVTQADLDLALAMANTQDPAADLAIARHRFLTNLDQLNP